MVRLRRSNSCHLKYFTLVSDTPFIISFLPVGEIQNITRQKTSSDLGHIQTFTNSYQNTTKGRKKGKGKQKNNFKNREREREKTSPYQLGPEKNSVTEYDNRSGLIERFRDLRPCLCSTSGLIAYFNELGVWHRCARQGLEPGSHGFDL